MLSIQLQTVRKVSDCQESFRLSGKFQIVKTTGLFDTLAQVLSPVVKFSPSTHKPELGKENTRKGELKWDLWFNSVIAPIVFDKHIWIYRKFTTEELAPALDYPSTQTAVMTDLNIERLTEAEVPGKVMATGLEPIRVLSRTRDINREKRTSVLTSLPQWNEARGH